jgi:Domain of unknown function (DUF1854)
MGLEKMATETRPKLDPKDVTLFHDEIMDKLRLSTSDRSYPTVKPVWSAPLTRPNKYLAMVDGKGEEIIMVQDPKSLSESNLAAIKRELYSRYLTAQVSKILNAKQEFGASYWTVETDRGKRDFVAQSLQENAQWLSDTHLVLIDVDGNRFEITDVSALDDVSKKFLYNIV